MSLVLLGCIGPLDVDAKKSTCRSPDSNGVEGCFANAPIKAWNDCSPSADACESGYTCCIGPLDVESGKHTCRSTAAVNSNKTNGCFTASSSAPSAAASSIPIDAWKNCDANQDICVENFKCCVGPLDFGIQKHTCRQSSPTFTNKPDGCYVPSARADVEAWSDCTPATDSCVDGFTCCVGPVDLSINKYTCRSTAEKYVNKNEGCFVAPVAASVASSATSTLSSSISTTSSALSAIATVTGLANGASCRVGVDTCADFIETTIYEGSASGVCCVAPGSTTGETTCQKSSFMRHTPLDDCYVNANCSLLAGDQCFGMGGPVIAMPPCQTGYLCCVSPSNAASRTSSTSFRLYCRQFYMSITRCSGKARRVSEQSRIQTAMQSSNRLL